MSHLHSVSIYDLYIMMLNQGLNCSGITTFGVFTVYATSDLIALIRANDDGQLFELRFVEAKTKQFVQFEYDLLRFDKYGVTELSATSILQILKKMYNTNPNIKYNLLNLFYI